MIPTSDHVRVGFAETPLREGGNLALRFGLANWIWRHETERNFLHVLHELLQTNHSAPTGRGYRVCEDRPFCIQTKARLHSLDEKRHSLQIESFRSNVGSGKRFPAANGPMKCL